MDRRPDSALRRDVRFLGRLLGEVLVEQEGRELFDVEERIRRLAIARRRGPREERARAAAELREVLSAMPLAQTEPVIRAFSHYFQLVNLAEQHHRIRRTRAHEMTPGAPPQPRSLAAVLQTARTSGIPAAQVRAAMASLRVTLAFTAHPTQATRRTILEKLYRIAYLLEQRDQTRQTPRERRETTALIREEITALWQTDDVRHDRPSVGDEVKNVLWYVEEILSPLLPALPERMVEAFANAYGARPAEPLSPLRIHSWVGGDMDGNPLVTPDVFEDTMRVHLGRGLLSLLQDVRELGAALSQSTRHVDPPEALLASIAQDAARLPRVAARDGTRAAGEPWRQKLAFVEARLAATLAHAEARRGQRPLERALSVGERDANALTGVPYAGPEELVADLTLVAASLAGAGAEHAGARRARALLARVEAMGFHIAELELRTRADDARDAAAFLASGGSLSEGGQRFLETLRRLAQAQREGGESACRTLILSMTHGSNDVLAALASARAAGLWDPVRSCATVDVVPLFEQLEDLDSSPRILRELFADPAYRPHVSARGVQEVMVGYSDSGKEVGLLAAAAALRRAQAALPAVAREAGVRLRIFHGRGESVARGGGPAQQAILALPKGAVAGWYKATEQGEALDQKYSRPTLALRTLELITGGVLVHSLDAQPQPPPAREAAFLDAFDRLAEEGRRAYRALVWEEPRFEEYFATATPLDEIARLNIGSRPSKRSSGGLESLRAIPWVFAWTQNRAILPGWYGAGSAFAAFATGADTERLLGEMYAEWPFFHGVVDNLEMVLAKTDLGVAALYADLAPDAARAAVWPRIRSEYIRTKRFVKQITGHARLLDGNPTLQRSISLRNPYVDPMSFLQVELLRRKRSGDGGCERPLLLTLNGIAAGMRNTG
jgi:phosphoenolpyruvate carboxylase